MSFKTFFSLLFDFHSNYNNKQIKLFIIYLKLFSHFVVATLDLSEKNCIEIFGDHRLWQYRKIGKEKFQHFSLKQMNGNTGGGEVREGFWGSLKIASDKIRSFSRSCSCTTGKSVHQGSFSPSTQGRRKMKKEKVVHNVQRKSKVDGFVNDSGFKELTRLELLSLIVIWAN